MKREKVYLIEQSINGFRPGIPAEIVGIEMCTPSPGLEPRLCYHLMYEDFFEDWKVVSEETYKIVTLSELLKDKTTNK